MISSTKTISFERVVPSERRWNIILLSVVCLTIFGLAAVDIIARSRGYGEVYPTATDVWVAQWFKLDHSPNERTVFLGTSRTKFGLILDDWEAATNERP